MPDRGTLKGKRDHVIPALLVGCALRRNELAMLDVETIQMAKAGGLASAFPNILLIPGTTSVDHLRKNFEGTTLQLPPDVIQNPELICQPE